MSPAAVETPRPRLSEALTAWLDALGENRTATLHALALLGAASAHLDLSTMEREVERVRQLPHLPTVLRAALVELQETLGGRTHTPAPAPLPHAAVKPSGRRKRTTIPPRESRDSRGDAASPTVAMTDASSVAARGDDAPVVAVEPVAPSFNDDDFDLGFTV